MRFLPATSLVALACLLLVPIETAAGQARWDAVSDAPWGNARQRHDDIKFLDGGVGWLVNTGGEIWRSDDAGVTWARSWYSPSHLFRSVAPLDPRTVFAGTVNSSGAVLFRTADGGDSWIDVTNRISGTLPAGICGMSVVSDRVVFGVGAYHGSATVIKTTNGGLSWTGVSASPEAETLIDVHFFDEMNGIAVGGTSEQLRGNAVVIRTTDGGDTWTRVHETTRASGISGEWGWKISFPSRLVGYVSVEYASNNDGQPAKVLKTVDGGLTWTAIDVTGSVSRAGLQGIGFLNEDVGWASGRGVTSLTEDGGQTWEQLLPWAEEVELDPQGGVEAGPEGQLDGAVNRIVFAADTLAMAVGRRVYRLAGIGSSTGVAGQRAPARPEAFTLEEAFPNPFSDRLTLAFSLARPATVRIEVIDALGRRHGLLRQGTEPAGRHTLTWDGRNDQGQRLPSGTYFLLIDIDQSPEMKQVVLIR